jgi:hypothetical protein
MNLHKMIAELQAEKQRLDEAILALERLSAGKPKRRTKALRGRRDVEELPEHEVAAAAGSARHSNI